MTAELAREAADPSTPPERLAALTAEHPALWPLIAANPACYPGLAGWIAAQRASGAVPAVEPAAIATVQPSVAPSAAAAPPGLKLMTIVASVVVGLLVLGGGGFAVAGALGAGPFSTAASSGPSGGPSGSGDGSDAESGGTPGDATSPAEGDAPAASTASLVVDVPEPAPTIVILDASGSMVRDVAEGGTRMDAARAAATAFVEALPDEAEIGLMVFGTGTGNSDAERAAGCFDVTTVMPVADLDRAAMTTAIAGIRESGYTPIGPALRAAAAQVPTDAASTIVLVSDGVDTCAPPPSCDIAAEVRQSHPLLTIHTIGFAVDADEEASAQLECVARVGGGEFASASNAAQLAAKLRVAADPTVLAGALTSEGYRGLRVGMSLDQARAAEGFELGEVRLEIQYAICDDAELLFRDGVLIEIRQIAESATVDGLAPGDTLDRAIALYGQPIATGTDDTGAYSDFAVTASSRLGYRVYAASGSVIRIVVCLCGPRASAPDDNLANWVIDFDGVGPLKVGANVAEIRAVANAEPWAEYCPSVMDVGSSSRVRVTSVGAWDAPDVNEFYTVVSAFDSAPGSGSPQTREGIGLGSSADALRAAYPGLSVVRWNKAERDYSIVTDRLGRSMIFGLDDTESYVDYILVGTATQPPWELCA